MDRQTDRRMAGGHDIIRPVFDGHIKSVFILYFNGANSITSNLGVTLKGKNLPPGSKFFPLRVAPNEEGDGFRLSHEKVHPFPS